jgi:hypothetical protein
MKKTQLHMNFAMRILYLGAVAWSCTPTLAAADTASGDAAAHYQRERADCLSGKSAQDTTTCLREAAAAQAQRLKGTVPDDAAALERNAQQRCDALPTDDRKACIARIQGQGSASGNVAGGGILRELVVTEPPASSAARPAAVTTVPSTK